MLTTSTATAIVCGIHVRLLLTKQSYRFVCRQRENGNGRPRIEGITVDGGLMCRRESGGFVGTCCVREINLLQAFRFFFAQSLKEYLSCTFLRHFVFSAKKKKNTRLKRFGQVLFFFLSCSGVAGQAPCKIFFCLSFHLLCESVVKQLFEAICFNLYRLLKNGLVNSFFRLHCVDERKMHHFDALTFLVTIHMRPLLCSYEDIGILGPISFFLAFCLTEPGTTAYPSAEDFCCA